ncbi:MAG: DNA repair protein RadA [Deltaproteobacteria bacterium]|nr:MAG: DNA repair protein RadA [Deltaproteobacteria bacterium]
MSKKIKTRFVCSACGYSSLKWLGKCPECLQWDTFEKEEFKVLSGSGRKIKKVEPSLLSDVKYNNEQRIATKIEEFDRVLGGGIVPGSLILIGGDPGIGKSTLMLQAASKLSGLGRRILYVSGEESASQIKLRSTRLDTAGDIFVLPETGLETVLEAASEISPDVLIIDSVQTIFSEDVGSAPGSLSQVREAAVRFMDFSKKEGVSTFLVGHVTKEGIIAGPRVLEHMVDTVLYFEGDSSQIYRILRAVKNRFGSTNEIGLFEMKEKGLFGIENPSGVFLSERPLNVAGSSVTATMEGSRPILIEIQGLVSGSNFGGPPRRTVVGVDPNRLALIIAVMEKKVGIHFSDHDVFVNAAGGVRVSEPASDLAVASAVASSFFDVPVPEDMIVLGEVGLTGELRGINSLEKRVLEAKKLGFKRFVLPESSISDSKIKDIKIMTAPDLGTAMGLIFEVK